MSPQAVHSRNVERHPYQSKVGIVVPTLGERPQLLNDCIRSIYCAGADFISIVSPNPEISQVLDEPLLVNQIVHEEKNGIASAINLGINALPSYINVCGWLGDDDLLEHESILQSMKLLEVDRSIVLVYGYCRYVDQRGLTLGVNRFGTVAEKIIGFGPCLIPQPGSIFRRDAFRAVGGLDVGLGWAFDLDLFLKLKKIGRFTVNRSIVSSFRWHQDSTTVKNRRRSVVEASSVRVSHQRAIPRFISLNWEKFVSSATYHAGWLVTKKARNLHP
jgi:GT2 family glycosyltransferase